MNILRKIYKALFEPKLNRREVKNTIHKVAYNNDNIEIIKMPNLNNKPFKLIAWFCKVGELINEGEFICELENESTTIEFQSYISGRLVEITTKKGVISTDEMICKIERV